MDNIVVKGNLKYSDCELSPYDRNFTAILTDAAAFDYGNNTAILITFEKMKCGRTPEPVYLDTRYIRIEKSNDGLKNFLRLYFAKYPPHSLNFIEE